LIATAQSPVDTELQNVYHFEGAHINRPLTGLKSFSDEKKESKAFNKKYHQNYINGCLESQQVKNKVIHKEYYGACQ
jgi:hypothetical protein